MIYMSRQERRDSKAKLDGQETNPPSYQELLNIVQELVGRCNKLEDDVSKLKSSGNIQQKKNILDELKNTVIPNMTCMEWVQTICVNDTQLNAVFERDIIEGIKLCIQNLFENGPNYHESTIDVVGRKNLPIRAFSQKQNTIYIWNSVSPEAKQPSSEDSKKISNELKWSVVSNEYFQSLLMSISRKFLIHFMKWYIVNKNEIDKCELKQEQHIVYMNKINSANSIIEKRSHEIKKWLFKLIERPLESNSFDYV